MTLDDWIKDEIERLRRFRALWQREAKDKRGSTQSLSRAGMERSISTATRAMCLL
jgi:hypothetical protein